MIFFSTGCILFLLVKACTCRTRVYCLLFEYSYSTREAFMKKVMSQQNFTNYPFVVECIKTVEKLFADIQAMERLATIFSRVVNIYWTHIPLTSAPLHCKMKKNCSLKLCVD